MAAGALDLAAPLAWGDAAPDEHPGRLICTLHCLECHGDRGQGVEGVNNRFGGPGSAHIRGTGCLLTGTELFNGNIQGGSNAPTGWAKGLSTDQEIRKHLDSRDHSRTRFGSLHFGVAVPEIADTRTRMSYLGPNQPIVPVSDPLTMFSRLYGGLRDRDSVASVLDPIARDLKKLSAALDADNPPILDRHLALVREFEQEMVRIAEESRQHPDHPEPDLPSHIEVVDDNTPQISRIQIDLMVNALANAMARVATLQFFCTTGQGRLRRLGTDEGHHTPSHEPDGNKQADQQLVEINLWFSREIAHPARRLKETPEPCGDGSMPDHTTIVWVNEPGKGNSHTLNDIPMVSSAAGPASGRAGPSTSRAPLTTGCGFRLRTPTAITPTPSALSGCARAARSTCPEGSPAGHRRAGGASRA